VKVRNVTSHRLKVTRIEYENEEKNLDQRKLKMEIIRSRGSSVSIVSDYGLDDRAIRVRSPAGAKNFSSNLCVYTGSGAHPASCTMGTGGPFPGGQSAAMSRSYISSPPKRHRGV
jgi:hypothetical protein